MRPDIIKTLKDGNPQYTSAGNYSFESFKTAVNKMYKNRDTVIKSKLGDIEFGKLVSSKKKEESQADALLAKFLGMFNSEESRGNVFLRYLKLNDNHLAYDFRERRNEHIKEITRLCKMMGMNFGKKVSGNDVYFGTFSVVWNAFISSDVEITPESFQQILREQIPEFELVVTEEILRRTKDMFEYICAKSLEIITGRLYEAEGGSEYEFKTGLDYHLIENAGKCIYEIPEDELDIDLDFDDIDAPNDFLNKQVQNGITLYFKGSDNPVEEDENEREVYIAQPGTEEDVRNLGDVSKLQVLEPKKPVREEAMDLINPKSSFALQREIALDTPFKQFYNIFKDKICSNEFWQINLFNCLDMLSDTGKSTDLLFDQILGYFDGEIEPAVFLSENRTGIVADFIKLRKDFEKKKASKKSGKKYMSNITKPQIAGEEDIPTTSHEVLLMLGMTEKDIQTEEKLGLKNRQLDTKKIDKILEETYMVNEEDMIDFVNLRDDQIKAAVGESYSRSDFQHYTAFDCKPEVRPPSESKIDLFPVSQFPPHISKVFGEISFLNELQTKVKDVAFDTDENMLVCAPTGAGKTNVALLTILREFNRVYDNVLHRTGEFKVVYISPLKALATEIVEKFQAKLGGAGVVVKEFTGDMTLTRQELLDTHIIVSTPEKWDVMTRKSDAITELVRLIIIDEIHLLDEERGRVLECIVARTSLTIERKQRNIRLVGLSATLPNYVEVATFMQVKKGLFYFNESYRPVPLYKKYIGVKNPMDYKKNQFSEEKGKRPQRGPDQREIMNQVLYDLVKDNLSRKEQVLVFVHSRKETIMTGMKMIERAVADGDTTLFAKPLKPVKESVIVNKDLKALVARGIGAHNAGLCRKDRRLIETAFLDGTLRVVVCTATLAWGINLPAHTVIIKGTDVYEPGVGFKDLSILDVQQIFGRAGRPQFDTYGEAVLITKMERLNYFMGMMTLKVGVKSQFESILLEALNAEIALGNITSIHEAYEYVKRTFFYVRAKKNPRSVGADTVHEVDEKIFNLIEDKLTYLHELRFIRYDRNNLLLEGTELGRICSHYYVNCQTMEKFCKYLNFYEDANVLGGDNGKNNVDLQGDIEDQDLLAILAQASEFEQIQVRQEELGELEKVEKNHSFFEAVHPEFKKLIGTMKGKLDRKAFESFKEDVFEKDDAGDKRAMDSYQKVMTLIQGYLSMQSYDNYSLVADTHYIVQNGSRILRCIYEISLKKNIAYLTMTVLKMCRHIENNIRDDLTCLRMFCYENVKRGVLNIRRGQDIKESKFFLEELTCNKIERKLFGDNPNYQLYGSIRNMRDDKSIGQSLKLSHGESAKLQRILWYFPLLDYEYSIRPIAQTILRVDLKIIPEFIYSKQFHLPKENFEIFVEFNGEILHHEGLGIYTKNLTKSEEPLPVEVSFFVPYKENTQAYNVYIMSDRFVGADLEFELNLKDVMIHTEKMEYTNLLDLTPLRISTLNNPAFERLYHIKYFNPIQTQIFHALYYTDNNCLIGAPTGSGKTIMAELGMLRIFANSPKKKIVYIGPYKALVKERLADWKKRLETREMNKKVIELTGDYTPDLEALISSDVLVTTPEKWDGISRNWQNRNYVTHVGLIIFDEIHLLGQDRGPVIEVIVSRMNYISTKINQKIRMIGLSTAMASGADVANWFGVPKHYMFNFRPSVRPVPVEIHFKGFPEKNYCPRMNSMNKPAFNDIKKFSPNAPVLVDSAH